MDANSISSRPPPKELESVTASEAKGSFGALLDRVVTRGAIAITKHDQIRAVILPVEQYEALLAQRKNPLSELEGEFESLVAKMQTPRAQAAGRALFDATPERLGRVAVARARRRKRA
jgi:prevent-host-death family protein